MNREKLSTISHGLGAFVVLLLVWELLVRALDVSPALIPPPSTVARSFWNSRELYLVHLGMTVCATFYRSLDATLPMSFA